jgi:hypothetical protein
MWKITIHNHSTVSVDLWIFTQPLVTKEHHLMLLFVANGHTLLSHILF